MHGLESVAYVGQRARDDDTHRIVDERLFDLVVDQPRENAFAIVWCGHLEGLGGLSAGRQATKFIAYSEAGTRPELRRRNVDSAPPKSNRKPIVQRIYFQQLTGSQLKPSRACRFR